MTESCFSNKVYRLKKIVRKLKLLNRKIDVIFIQETHSDVKNAADWMQEWDKKSKNITDSMQL